MIRYALKCANGHSFESWFHSAEAYDELASRGLVCCAICGSDEVEKSIMAPRVASRSSDKKAGPLSQPASMAEQTIREFRRKVLDNSTYVGPKFAEMARQMHVGDAPETQIHGEATMAEAKELVEDGVPVMPLPTLPKSQTN